MLFLKLRWSVCPVSGKEERDAGRWYPSGKLGLTSIPQGVRRYFCYTVLLVMLSVEEIPLSLLVPLLSPISPCSGTCTLFIVFISLYPIFLSLLFNFPFLSLPFLTLSSSSLSPLHLRSPPLFSSSSHPLSSISHLHFISYSFFFHVLPPSQPVTFPFLFVPPLLYQFPSLFIHRKIPKISPFMYKPLQI